MLFFFFLLLLCSSPVNSALTGLVLFTDFIAEMQSEWKSNAERECPRIMAMAESGVGGGRVEFVNNLFDCDGRDADGYYSDIDSFWGRLGTFVRALAELPFGR
uniref:Secreted protein n=1 Tax=Caenorhabditis tropicalis TaxID=1561998 RepID=A0A1I7UTC1_9PELO